MDIENDIKAAGLTAPRVTPADVEGSIKHEAYFTAANGYMGEWTASTKGPREQNCPAEFNLLTFCVMVLDNGYTVTGESACASPENFDAELGRKIARVKAVEKIWPLLGFRLRDKLVTVAKPPTQTCTPVGMNVFGGMGAR